MNAIRQHPLFSCVFGFALLCALVPLWTPHLLPLVDWPQHLGIVAFLKHKGDPSWGFGLYARTQTIYTYITFYQLTDFFALFLPPDAAGRVTLSLYMVGTPIAGVWMLRCFQLSHWPALLIVPVLYNWCFYMGFAPFVVCFPMFLLGIGLMKCLADEVTWQRVVGLVALTLLLFISHSFAYLMFGFVALLMVFLYHLRSLKGALLTCLAWVPSIGLFIYWAFVTFGEPPQHYLMTSMTAKAGGGLLGLLRADYLDWKQIFYGLFGYFNNAFMNTMDTFTYIGWLAAVLLLLETGWRWEQRRYKDKCKEVEEANAAQDTQEAEADGVTYLEMPEAPTPFFVEPDWLKRFVLVMSCLALYFIMPMSLLGVWAVSPRFIPMWAMMCVLLIPNVKAKSWEQLILFLPALFLCLWTGYANHTMFARFNAEASGLEQVLDKLPKGKRTYGLMYDNYSQHMKVASFLHLPAYAMVKKGGLVGFSHFLYRGMPGKIKRPSLSPFPGSGGEWRPNRWLYSIYGLHYDYLLVRGGDYLIKQTKSPKGRLKKVASHQNWSLFHNPSASSYWPLFSFRENLPKAKVIQRHKGKQQLCPLKAGPHFQCPLAGWAKVKLALPEMGAIKVPCIWAHPVPQGTVSLSFANLHPKGALIQGVMGLTESAKQGKDYGPPVLLEILVDGKLVASQKSSCTKAFVPYHASFSPTTKAHSVTFRISAKQTGRRHFCFTGTLFQKK